MKLSAKGKTMEYIGNKMFWDSKFNSRTNNPLSPEPEIVNNINSFIGNSVLDIACGDGRNSLYLLHQGYSVTGIDFSTDGLSRLGKFASEYTESLNLIEADLSLDDSLDNIKSHDNVVICHYRLSKTLLRKLQSIVNSNGIVLITGFSETHKCDNKIGSNELIYYDDIKVLFDTFDLIKQSEFDDKRGNFITYLLKKR